MRDWYYRPADWISERTSARERRAHGFWLGMLFVVFTILTWTRVDHRIAGHALSALTLLLLCWTIITTETPVETEDE